MTTAIEKRSGANRRKGNERRLTVDQRYKSGALKNKRTFSERRRGERRKNISAFVTCRGCGELFIITKDELYKMTRENKTVLCPKGCQRDNTMVAKAALLMAEREKRK